MFRLSLLATVFKLLQLTIIKLFVGPSDEQWKFAVSVEQFDLLLTDSPHLVRSESILLLAFVFAPLFLATMAMSWVNALPAAPFDPGASGPAAVHRWDELIAMESDSHARRSSAGIVKVV